MSFWLLVPLLCVLPLALEARSPYIVGGNDVSQPGKYPWQASLQDPDFEHHCGASLISSRWLLTAAHCVILKPVPNFWNIVLGINDLKQQTTHYVVDKVVLHPHFRIWPPTRAGDIALLRLSKDVDISSPYVRPITLADAGQSFLNNPNCWITGWGKMNISEDLPNVLQVWPGSKDAARLNGTDNRELP